VNECILGKCNDLHNRYIVDRDVDSTVYMYFTNLEETCKRKSEAFNPVLNENLLCSHAIQSKWNCKGAVLVAWVTLLTTDSWIDLCFFFFLVVLI
jgi:hypothetical protein